jgi:hypothetical protein
MIRDNPLQSIRVRAIPLPSTFLLVLPSTIKHLDLVGVFLPGLLPFQEQVDAVPSLVPLPLPVQIVAPETLCLRATYPDWHGVVARQPTSFFQHLKVLEVNTFKKGPTNYEIHPEFDFFGMVHQRIVSRSPSLRTLKIRLSNFRAEGTFVPFGQAKSI